MSLFDLRRQEFSHARHEGPSEWQLRYYFQEAKINYTTMLDGISLPEFDSKDRVQHSHPDLEIPVKAYALVFDDGAVHFEPRQIDFDLRQNVLLAALGYKVFRFQHLSKNITRPMGLKAVDIFKAWTTPTIKRIDLEKET